MNPPDTHHYISEKLHESLKTALSLSGHKEALQAQQAQLFQDIEEAKKWLAKKPDYLRFLQHLQHLLHQKSIGTFSSLLTHFVKEVLKKDKEIALELYTYHNMPALRIEAINDGFKENIYEGNGGSIANIVSTGLRLISLQRLPNRKFIVLDEPDCWLEPKHVPIFAHIIGELSRRLGIQTVLISHHSWEYFKNYGRVIHLKKESSHLETEILFDTPCDSPPQDYITHVKMRRFMSHYDTTYALHPHLTCIVGTNDIGKSVIAAALKAVSYGDSADSYIQHTEQEAQVEIDFSDNTQILWQRFLNTNADNPQKVKFSLFKNNVLERSEYNSQESPTFIADKLKISMPEDIDIHIGNQKQPVFLLSGDVKPQERAKILSLGKESLILQKMMETIKTKTRLYQQTLKNGEAQYDRVMKQLKVLENLEQTIEKNHTLLAQEDTLENLRQTLAQLDTELPNYELLSTVMELKTVNSLQGTILEPLSAVSSLEQEIVVAQQYSSMSALQAVPPIDAVLLEPLSTAQALQQDTAQIAQLTQLSAIENTSLITSVGDALSLYPVLEQEIKKTLAWEQLAYVELAKPLEEARLVPLQPSEQLAQDIQSLLLLERATTIELVKPVQCYAASPEHEQLLQELEQLSQAQQSLQEWESKGVRLQGWKNTIAQEIEQFLEISGHKCPTCGHHLSANDIKDHIDVKV